MTVKSEEASVTAKNETPVEVITEEKNNRKALQKQKKSENLSESPKAVHVIVTCRKPDYCSGRKCFPRGFNWEKYERRYFYSQREQEEFERCDKTLVQLKLMRLLKYRNFNEQT